MPDSGHPVIRAIITEATGLVPDLPKTVSTGCGVRRLIATISMVPDKVTCLPWRWPRRSPPVKGRSRSFDPGPSTRAGPYGLPLVPRGVSCPAQSILAAYCGPLTRGARRWGSAAVGVRERWLIML